MSVFIIGFIVLVIRVDITSITSTIISIIISITAGTRVDIEHYNKVSIERCKTRGRGIAGGFGIAYRLVAYALILASISAYAISILALILGRRLRSGVI